MADECKDVTLSSATDPLKVMEQRQNED